MRAIRFVAAVILVTFMTPTVLGQAQKPPPPVAAKTVTLDLTDATIEAVAAAIQQQTGIALSYPKPLTSRKLTIKASGPFWSVAERVAAETNCRLRVHDGKVQFVPLPPGVAAPLSSVDGPFRVAVKQVVSKHDFETGQSLTEVHLDLAWEPRFPVYLVDAEPKVTEAKGTNGAYKADAPGGRVSVTGYSHPFVVRLRDVPRGESKLEALSGSLQVIAAERMLPVEFKNLTSDKPVAQSVEGVNVTLQPVKLTAGKLEVAFDLEYPPTHPEFESFQQWAATNKLRLTNPAGQALGDPDDYNTVEVVNGRRVRATYFYDRSLPKGVANLKGWRAVYETPCPMVQQEVRFTLKNIALP